MAALKGDFDEGKHPRADDGKFGHGTGGPKLPGAGGGKPSPMHAPMGASAKPNGGKPAGAKKPGAAKKPSAKKFNSKPHDRAIARHRAAEAKHRTASIAIKAQMAEVKAKAKTATPKQKAALKARFEKLKAKRDELKGKASEAKQARTEATAKLKEARAAHREKIKADRAKAKTERPARKPRETKPTEDVRSQTATATPPQAPASPLSDHDYKAARESFRQHATRDEAEASNNYTGTYFSDINGSLRNPEAAVREPAIVAHAVKHLDTALEKSRTKTPVVTYRGAMGHSSFDKLKVGSVFVDHGFVSTSSHPDFARDGDYLFHITSPAGTKIGAITGGTTEFEKEMLLARSSAMRLDKIEKGKRRGPDGDYDVTVMHVTVIGQK
jgi:ADP-ribosyltransferase exoenzyme